jgi:hypothetical protein
VDHRPIHLLVEIDIEGIERAIAITKGRLFVSTLEQSVLPAQELVGHKVRDQIDWGPPFRSARAAIGFRERPPCRTGGVDGARDRARRDSSPASCFAIDEIAIDGELPNERVDLADATFS